jgi:hypothetical protein
LLSVFRLILLGMAKASRDKGKAGEGEYARLAKSVGLAADRTASLQAGRVLGAADVALWDFPELHVEVKRDERMSVDAMVRQADAEAGEMKVPVVAWRRNRQQWRMDVPALWLLDLLRELRDLRAEVVRAELDRVSGTNAEGAHLRVPAGVDLLSRTRRAGV